MGNRFGRLRHFTEAVSDTGQNDFYRWIEEENLGPTDPIVRAKIEFIVRQFVVPENIIHVLTEIDHNVLSTADKQQISREVRNHGDMAGAVTLFNRLVQHEGWFDCLRVALRHPDIKQPHVARLMEKVAGVEHPEGEDGDNEAEPTDRPEDVREQETEDTTPKVVADGATGGHGQETDVCGRTRDTSRQIFTMELQDSQREEIVILQEKGVDFYLSRQFEAARSCFNIILKHLEKDTREDAEERHRLTVMAHLNLSACELKLGNYTQVLDHCQLALQIDETSDIAYMRMFQANKNLAQQDYLNVERLGLKTDEIRKKIEKLDIDEERIHARVVGQTSSSVPTAGDFYDALQDLTPTSPIENDTIQQGNRDFDKTTDRPEGHREQETENTTPDGATGGHGHETMDWTKKTPPKVKISSETKNIQDTTEVMGFFKHADRLNAHQVEWHQNQLKLKERAYQKTITELQESARKVQTEADNSKEALRHSRQSERKLREQVESHKKEIAEKDRQHQETITGLNEAADLEKQEMLQKLEKLQMDVNQTKEELSNSKENEQKQREQVESHKKEIAKKDRQHQKTVRELKQVTEREKHEISQKLQKVLEDVNHTKGDLSNSRQIEQKLRGELDTERTELYSGRKHRDNHTYEDVCCTKEFSSGKIQSWS